MTKDIFDVKIGDKIGFVDGPGVQPEDNVGEVTKKVEDRWGKHLVVKLEDRETTVHVLSTVGIGAYLLP